VGVVTGWSAGAQDSASVDSRLLLARELVAKGDFKGAEPMLRGMISADGNPVEAEYLLGYVLLRLNRPKESLDVYTRAAALRTPEAEDLKRVADDYVLLTDFDDADRWMLRAVRMQSKDADLWYGLGRIRYSLQHFQDAVTCFQKALLLAPTSVKAEDNLGLAYEGLNRREDAVAAYQRALELQKNSARQSEQPMLNLGIVYVDDGKLDEALPLLTRAAEIAPGDPRIHEQLGQLYLKKDHLHEARAEFERAVGLLPNKAAYHYLLGRVLQRLGQVDEAKAEMERATALNGTHSSPE
jgi:tetratricopeptide (TPR) repeat protein